MTNKKILMSIAAAGALAFSFTGCGTDEVGGSSISGIAQKASLNNADVTIGSATAKTNANGEYTVSGATGTTIEVSGGTMTLPDGTTVDNNLTLKATTSGNDDGIVSIATTLIEEFKGNGLTAAAAKTAAQNLLGVTEDELYTAPDLLSGDDTDAVNTKKNKQALIWNVLAAVKDSSGAKTAVLDSLKNASDGNGSAISDGDFDDLLTNAINDAAAADSSLSLTDVNNSVATLALPANLVKQEEAVVKAAASNDTTVTEIAFSNVFNLEGNASSTTNAVVSYSTDLSSYTGLKYVNEANISTTTAAFDDANNTAIKFAVKDQNSSLSTNLGGTYDDNATGELLLSLTALDSDGSNGNTSYRARINNLLVGLSSDYVTLNTHANTTLVVTATSNTSAAINLSGSDVNVTALLGNDGNLTNASDSNLTVNIATFANYIKSIAGPESSSTNGNFTVDMNGSGQYEFKAYIDVNDNNFTYNSGINKAGRGSVTVNGTAYKGYKIIDANLTK